MLARASKPQKEQGGRRMVRPVFLHTLGVDAIKARVFGALKVEAPGPGYLHAPHDRDLQWFEELIGEKPVVRTSSGRPYVAYVKRFGNTTRVEGLDCRVYAYAARLILQPAWDALARNLDDAVDETPAVEPETQPDPAVVAAARRQRPARQRRSWVTGWRG